MALLAAQDGRRGSTWRGMEPWSHGATWRRLTSQTHFPDSLPSMFWLCEACEACEAADFPRASPLTVSGRGPELLSSSAPQRRLSAARERGEGTDSDRGGCWKNAVCSLFCILSCTYSILCRIPPLSPLPFQGPAGGTCSDGGQENSPHTLALAAGCLLECGGGSRVRLAGQYPSTTAVQHSTATVRKYLVVRCQRQRFQCSRDVLRPGCHDAGQSLMPAMGAQQGMSGASVTASMVVGCGGCGRSPLWLWWWK